MNGEIEALLKAILEMDELPVEWLDRIQSCEYLIILDMGCGSTSAAILDLKEFVRNGAVKLQEYLYPILWNYKTPSARGNGTLEMANKQVSIPTLIGYSDLKPLIGPEALNTGNVCENFKACPSDQNLNKVVLQIATWDRKLLFRRLADVWPDYFGCLMDQICRWIQEKRIGQGDRLTMRQNTLMMVAHPAGAEWSRQSVLKSYRDIISRGTGLPKENILTISEAKAAMQYVRRKYDKALDFHTGVVIIDIGASTIDVEYLARDLAEPYEYSLTMAGRDVDLLLLHYVLEKVFPSTMQEYPDPRSLPEEKFFGEFCSCTSALLKWNMRSSKEDISNMEYDSAQRGSSFSYTLRDKEIVMSADVLCGLLGDETNDPLTGAMFGGRSFAVSYPLEMAAYVHDMRAGAGEAEPWGFAVQVVEDTWYGHLENLIRYVMDDLGQNERRAAQVIVTGGSCRLAGIRPHIWNAIRNSEMGAFLCREDQILYMDKENDYENSVPFGGGYYVGGLLGRLNVLQEFPQRLYKVLFQELKGAAAREITRELNALVRGITLETLEWWKNQPLKKADGTQNEDCSTYRLNEKLKSDCTRIFQETAKLNEAMERATKNIVPKVSLPDTMRVIMNLLDTLAGAKFTGTVDTDAVKIRLPVERVSRAVREVDPDTLHLEFWKSIGGLLQDLGNTILNWFGMGVERDDILRSASYRAAVYEAYKGSERDSVEWLLEKEISLRLDYEFKKTDIFNIPDQIIRGLKQDVMRALYLN
ncbi:hypothetical protein D7X48_04985 [bacterium D16-50]|nr:hypothetical protein D7X48_04985 [bacterium D16-50]